MSIQQSITGRRDDNAAVVSADDLTGQPGVDGLATLSENALRRVVYSRHQAEHHGHDRDLCAACEDIDQRHQPPKLFGVYHFLESDIADLAEPRARRLSSTCRSPQATALPTPLHSPSTEREQREPSEELTKTREQHNVTKTCLLNIQPQPPNPSRPAS